MYYPPLFNPLRPFESQANLLGGAGDGPVVGTTTGRENPLDLSVKPTLRQGTDPGTDAETADLLMLDHRKLANLAASHSLSAMGRQLGPGAAHAAAILDPTLYRLAYGPEAMLPAPFCYDRATGVAVPTSLAGHQLMSSFLQQRERCLEQQQAALLAARSSAQQAAVGAAYMDLASLPYGLRTAMSQREAAAALAATRGLYAPTMPTPMVLPAFSLYTDDKGAFTSLRNGGAAEKAYINGAAAAAAAAVSGGAVEAARFAEHLQRLREQQLNQAGKCNNACCTGIPGLNSTVPCACCIQSPSQAAICARSPMGCMKDPTTAATGKACNTACDYLQPGLTFLHRPTAANGTPNELRLSVPNYCTSTFTTSTTDVTSSAPVFQPAPSWSTGLPGVSTNGKTAFSVPKKKEAMLKGAATPSFSQKEPKVTNGHTDREQTKVHHHEIPKREPEIFIKKEPSRTRDTERDVIVINESVKVPSHQRREHDVESMLTPKAVAYLPPTPNSHSHQHHTQHSGIAQTVVTAATPVVPTRCEGGTIPKTKLPPVLEAYRPMDHTALNGDLYPDGHAAVPSTQGPPPLIAVSNHYQPSKERYSFPDSSSSMLRHQGLLHGTAMSTPVSSNSSSIASESQKYQKSPKKAPSVPSSKINDISTYIKEEISTSKPIQKPVPQIPTAHHAPVSHYTSTYRPFAIQTHPNWIPPANPNVTVSPTVPPSKTTPSAATSVVTSHTSSVATPSHKIVKSEPLPVASIKKELDYDHNANVLQSLLVRPGQTHLHPHSSLPVSSNSLPATQHPSVIMSNPNSYPILDYHQYQQLTRGVNLSHSNTTKRSLIESGSPATACTAPESKQDVKVECGNSGLDFSLPTKLHPKKRPHDTLSQHYNHDDKKKAPNVDYPMAPGFAFQYPVFKGSETKDVPLCPYTFVPEPPGYYESQMVVPKEIRPLKGNVPKSLDVPQMVISECAKTPLRGVSEAFHHAGISPLSTLMRLHLNNVRRANEARSRSKLRKRVLTRIYQANLKRKASPAAVVVQDSPKDEVPDRSTEVARRIFYKISRRRRIKSGLDMVFKRNKKKRPLLCKIQREVLPASECESKVADASLSIPAEMKKLMVNKALGETVLHRAARQGYSEVVAYCLETNGANVNARDNAGYTPLHECCSRGNLDIARALLQCGADVNASAAGGIRPLHDAVENDHVEVVRLLLSFGADPTISTYSGLTPLKFARSPLMAEFLQGFMADISGDVDSRPHLPWRFWGSSRCLDQDDNGYDIFGGVPSDEEVELEGEGNDFLFEVSDSPHLPTFRLALSSSCSSKAQCNYLRLSDVLCKTSMSRSSFMEHCQHIEVTAVPRHEFEASATCSQLLTGSKLDTLFVSSRTLQSDSLDGGHVVELVRLDNNIRKVLGIETISVR